MSAIASPYGLRPVAKIGYNPMTHGQREFKVSANNAAAMYVGDIIQLTAGQPAAMGATPTTASAGVVGVCVGVRYSLPQAMGGAVMFGQYLPANAINAGYTDVWVVVVDDPNTIFQVQASGAISAPAGVIGRNVPVGNFGGNAATGVSTVRAETGANGVGAVTTNTVGFRIVGVVGGTEGDAFPELLVKFNGATHSYNNPLGA